MKWQKYSNVETEYIVYKSLLPRGQAFVFVIHVSSQSTPFHSLHTLFKKMWIWFSSQWRISIRASRCQDTWWNLNVNIESPSTGRQVYFKDSHRCLHLPIHSLNILQRLSTKNRNIDILKDIEMQLLLKYWKSLTKSFSEGHLVIMIGLSGRKDYVVQHTQSVWPGRNVVWTVDGGRWTANANKWRKVQVGYYKDCCWYWNELSIVQVNQSDLLMKKYRLRPIDLTPMNEVCHAAAWSYLAWLVPYRRWSGKTP